MSSSTSELSYSKDFWSQLNKSDLVKDDGDELPDSLLEMFPNQPVNELRIFYHKFNGNIPEMIDYFGSNPANSSDFNIKNDNIDDIPMQVLIESINLSQQNNENNDENGTNTNNNNNNKNNNNNNNYNINSNMFTILPCDLVCFGVFCFFDVSTLGRLLIINHDCYNIVHKIFKQIINYDFTHYFTSTKGSNSNNKKNSSSQSSIIINNNSISAYRYARNISFFNRFPSLQSIILKNSSFESFDRIFNKQLLCKSNLKELNLTNCNQLLDDNIYDICNLFENLQSLNLSKTMISDESMIYMAQYMPPKLKTLIINQCDNITSLGINIMLKGKANGLTKLFWRFGKCNSADPFKYNLSMNNNNNGARLKYLDLVGSKNLVHFILKDPKKQEKYGNNKNKKFQKNSKSNKNKNYYKNNNNKNKGNVKGNNKKEESFLTLNLSNCTRLETIEIDNIDYIYEINVSQCKNLKLLKIEHCNNLQIVNCFHCFKLRRLKLPQCNFIRHLNLNHCDRLILTTNCNSNHSHNHINDRRGNNNDNNDNNNNDNDIENEESIMSDESDNDSNDFDLFFNESLINGHLFCLNMGYMNQLTDGIIDYIISINNNYLNKSELDSKVEKRTQNQSDYQLQARLESAVGSGSSTSSLDSMLSNKSLSGSASSSLLNGEYLCENSSFLSINKNDEFMPVLSGLCEFDIQGCQNVSQSKQQIVGKIFNKPKARSKRQYKRKLNAIAMRQK